MCLLCLQSLKWPVCIRERATKRDIENHNMCTQFCYAMTVREAGKKLN
jgi:hypothetical protein